MGYKVRGQVLGDTISRTRGTKFMQKAHCHPVFYISWTWIAHLRLESRNRLLNSCLRDSFWGPGTMNRIICSKEDFFAYSFECDSYRHQWQNSSAQRMNLKKQLDEKYRERERAESKKFWGVSNRLQNQQYLPGHIQTFQCQVGDVRRFSEFLPP